MLYVSYRYADDFGSGHGRVCLYGVPYPKKDTDIIGVERVIEEWLLKNDGKKYNIYILFMEEFEHKGGA